MTAIEQARDRNGQTIADRFRFDGTSLWFLVRDAFFERDGGILDLTARAADVPRRGGQSPHDVKAPNVADMPEQSPGFRSLRIAHAKSAIEVLGRTALSSLRHLAPSRLLVVTPHGAASRRELELPLDRWSAPYRTLLERTGATWISLFPPRRLASWSQDLLADWQAISDGRYVPWQAGLTALAWPVLIQRRARFRQQLGSLWHDTAWRESWFEALPPGAHSTAIDELKQVFTALDRDLGLAWLLIVAANALTQRVRPSVLVTFDTLGNAGRAFVHAAHRQKIRTVGVQTGIISPTGVANLGFRLDRADSRAPGPQNLWLWGPRYQETLASFGWPTDALHSVGFAECDLTQRPGVQDPTRYAPVQSPVRELLLLANANVGICSAIARPADELHLIARIIHALSRRDSASHLRLLVRCHPATIDSGYGRDLANLCARFDNIVFDDAGVSLAQRIAEADLVLGSSSTGLIEAARAGKPVIVLNPSGLEITGFERYDVPVIGQTDDIAARFDEILRDDARLSRARDQLVVHAAPDLDLVAVEAMMDTWMSVSPDSHAGTSIVRGR